MHLYQFAFVGTLVCSFVVAVVQENLRDQVHRAHYGNQEIHPFDVRFTNNLFTIWKMHKQVFQKSRLRTVMMTASVGAILFLSVAALDSALGH